MAVKKYSQSVSLTSVSVLKENLSSEILERTFQVKFTLNELELFYQTITEYIPTISLYQVYQDKDEDIKTKKLATLKSSMISPEIIMCKNATYVLSLDQNSPTSQTDQMSLGVFGQYMFTGKELFKIREELENKQLCIRMSPLIVVLISTDITYSLNKDSSRSNSSLHQSIGSKKELQNSTKSKVKARDRKKLAIKKNLTIKHQGHLLKKPNHGKFNLCSNCNLKTNKPIYKCKLCQMAVHTHSIKKLVIKCRQQPGAKKDDAVLIKTNTKDSVRNRAAVNIPHAFEDSSSNKNCCSHCGSKFKMFGEKHKKCKMCDKHYHTKCSELAPPLCGVSPEIIKSLMNIGQAKPVNEAKNSFKKDMVPSSEAKNPVKKNVVPSAKSKESKPPVPPRKPSINPKNFQGQQTEGFYSAIPSQGQQTEDFYSAIPSQDQQTEDIYDNLNIFTQSLPGQGCINDLYAITDDLIDSKEQTKQAEVNLNLNMFVQEIKPLGEGAFGIVYKATYLSNSKQYAVKAQQLDLGDDDMMDSLAFEVQVMKKVYSHAYTVDFYGSFVENGYIFMVMNLCPGGTLSSILCEDEIELTVDIVREVIAQQCTAIEFLHGNKLIMRDIKPDNIMIDDKGRSKMLDFGLSKDLTNSNYLECRTYCGTPEYMSPEVSVLCIDRSNLRRPLPQFLDNDSYSFECDWWSIAITMYEMLNNGRMPFTEANDEEKRLETVTNAVTNFRDFPIDASICVANRFLKAMLKKNMYQRLGPKQNIEKVGYYRDHPFFETINWNELESEFHTGPFPITPIPTNVISAEEAPKLLKRNKWPKSRNKFPEEFNFSSFKYCSESLTTSA